MSPRDKTRRDLQRIDGRRGPRDEHAIRWGDIDALMNLVAERSKATGGTFITAAGGNTGTGTGDTSGGGGDTGGGVSPADPLPVPQGLTLTSSVDGASGIAYFYADWNAVPGAAQYHLEVRLDGGNPMVVPCPSSYYQAAVVAGTVIAARVRSVTTAGALSAYSATANHVAQSDTVPPAIPVNLSAMASFSSIWIAWDRNTEVDLTRYDLYEASSASPFPSVSSAPSFSTPSAGFNRAGLPEGATRFYWVRAVDRSGNASGWAGPISATTLALTTDIDAAAADATQALSDAAAVATELSGLSTDFDARVLELNQLSTDFTATQGDLSTAEGNIGTLQTDLTNVSSDVATLQTEMNTAQGDVLSLQGTTSTLSGTLTTVEGSISSLQLDLTTVENDLATADGQIGTLEGTTSSLQTAMTSVEGDVSALQTDVAAANTSISTAQGAITTLEGTTSSMQGAITSIEGDVSAIQQDVTTAETMISDISGDVSTLTATTSSMQGAITSIEGDVSAVQDDIIAVNAAISTTDGNVSTVTANVSDLSTAFATLDGVVQAMTGVTAQTTSIDGVDYVSGFQATSYAFPGGGGSVLELLGDQVIARGSLTVSRLVVSDMTNLVPDPYATDPEAWLGNMESPDGTVEIVPLNPIDGWEAPFGFRLAGNANDYVLVASRGFQVEAGTVLHIANQGYLASGTGSARMRVEFAEDRDFAVRIGGVMSSLEIFPGAVTKITHKLTVPTGARYARVHLTKRSNGSVEATMAAPVVRLATTAEIIVDGAITARHIASEEVITERGQIRDAIIDNAHITDLNAAKLTAGTALASSITVNGTAIGTVEQNAADPGAVVNSGTTQILPGRINITGATTLEDWRGTTDQTRINGGVIETNSITTNALAAGSVDAEQIHITQLLSLDEATAGFSFGKTSAADMSDGMYMGRSGSSGGFGFHVGRTKGDGTQQYIQATKDTDLSLVNARFYRDLTPNATGLMITSDRYYVFPPGANRFSMEVVGGGGGGGGGGRGNGQDGSTTKVELWHDGGYVRNWTASGGDGGDESQWVRGQPGRNNPLGTDFGTGGSRGEGYNTSSAHGGDASGFGSGGGGGGSINGGGGDGGRAGELVVVTNRWIGDLSNPYLRTTMGQGGAGGNGETGINWYMGDGGDGTPGMMRVWAEGSSRLAGNIVTERATATGVFWNNSGDAFPNIGAGIWTISEISGGDMGITQLNTQTAVISARTGTVTFIAPWRPWIEQYSHSAMIRYEFRTLE